VGAYTLSYRRREFAVFNERVACERSDGADLRDTFRRLKRFHRGLGIWFKNSCYVVRAEPSILVQKRLKRAHIRALHTANEIAAEEKLWARRRGFWNIVFRIAGRRIAVYLLEQSDFGHLGGSRTWAGQQYERHSPQPEGHVSTPVSPYCPVRTLAAAGASNASTVH
jgi:hypothetical protein